MVRRATVETDMSCCKKFPARQKVTSICLTVSRKAAIRRHRLEEFGHKAIGPCRIRGCFHHPIAEAAGVDGRCRDRLRIHRRCVVSRFGICRCRRCH